MNRRRRSINRVAVLALTAVMAVSSWLSDATTARGIEPSAIPTESPAPSPEPTPVPSVSEPSSNPPSALPEPSATPAPAASPSATPGATPPSVQSNADEPAVVPDPAKDHELVDRRTATSRSWDVGDGKVSTELFSEPIFYQPAGESGFVPIMLDFSAKTDGTAQVDRSPTTVKVGGSDDRAAALTLISAEGFTVAYWPLASGASAEASAPSLTKSVADVSDVLPGVDLRVSARADGANVWLVLAEAPTEARWTFVLDVPAGTTITSVKGGSLELRDDKDVVRATIAAPYAVDSTPDEFTGSGRMTSGLHYELGTSEDGRPTLTTVLDDAEWLAKAVYPVYVDPSTTLVNPGSNSYGDTFINEGNAGQNYANYQRPDSPTFYEMWLGESPSDPTYLNHALLKFDIGTISGYAIDGAELQLRPYHAYYDAPTERGIWGRKVTSGWTEAGATWTARPSWSGSVTTTCAESSGLSCLLDVTGWTREWINASQANYGLAVDTGAYNSTYWKRLISSEQAHSTSPRLVVTYHDPVTAVAPTSAAKVGSRTLAWTFDTTTTGATQGKFHVDVSTDPTFVAANLATSGDVTGTPGAAASWAIPAATSLTPGATYHWRVKVGIGAAIGWSQWAVGSFVWDPEVNLGRQPRYTFESWDLGGGDSLAVNVATGNLVVSHPVANLPIRGGSLPITLTYNAHDAADIGFGPGWRMDLQRRLTINGATNDVTYVDAAGARHLFVDVSTIGNVTTYVIPTTIDASLVRDIGQTGQEFTLTNKDRSTDVFKTVGSSGLLRYVRDRYGNQVTVNYSGSTTDITTVTDPNSRTITFTWNADTIHHVTSIVDWAVVVGGIVQTSGTANRANRFFYTSGVLVGWADPLNTASSSCASAASHLTCLTYSSSLLASIAKTQTITTFSAGTLGTTTATPTTVITYAGTDAVAVRDASQTSTTETKFVWTSADTISVTRKGAPDLVVAYRLEGPADAYGRVSTTTRAPGGSQVVTKTTWNGTYPAKVASTIEDFGGSLARTTSGTWAAGVIGPNLTVTTEPVTGSENRTTTNTFNGNDDITRTVDASSVSGSMTTDFSYSSGTGCAGGLLLCSTIENRVDGTKGGSNGHIEDVTTDYQYDGTGLRARQTRSNYASGGTLLDAAAIGWTYDTNGNVTSEIANYTSGTVTGPTGDDVIPNTTTNARTDLTTSYGYDTAGNRVSTADPRRAVETAKGTTLGSDDFIVRWTFDGLDQQVTEATPTTPGITVTQTTSSATYDEFGGARSSVDFGDRVSASQSDPVGRVVESYEDIDGAGGTAAVIVAKSGYETAGRLLWSEDQVQTNDPAGGTDPGRTELTYDVLGRAIASVANAGSATPAIASTTSTTYDALGRETVITTGTESSTAQTTRTAYDIGGRVTSLDDEFTCTTTSYDYRGLATQVIEGKVSASPCTGSGSRTLNQTYDALGRMTSRVVASTGDTLEASTFDGAGRASKTWSTVAATSTSLVVELTFNALDEPITEYRYTDTSGTLSAKTWARSNHDPAGNETDRCTWSATPSEFCHTASDVSWASPAPTSKSSARFDARNNRVEQYTPGVGATTYDPTANYQVAAVYVPTVTGKEHQTLYAYDGRNRVVTITQQLCVISTGHACSSTTPTGANTYVYDGNDNRTQVTEDNGSGSVTTYYCYDARNQLEKVSTASSTCASGVTETYGYDAAGNRTTAGGRTIAYDAEGQLATCSGSPACSPVFDADGRLIKITTVANGTWSYTYDDESRLTGACQNTSCTGSGFARLDSTYDGEGHRTQLKETTAGGAVTTTAFTYAGEVVTSEASTSSAATITRTFATDDAGAIIKVTISGDSTTLNNGDYLVTWNGHGDALALSKIDPSTGVLTSANRYTYTSWGTPTTTALNSYADLGFRYLYVGRFDVQWDSSTAIPAGLVYMHARHYSPELGRFLQPDPAAAETNLYAYAENGPITRVDPSGECFVPLIGQIICAAAAVYYIGTAIVAFTTAYYYANWYNYWFKEKNYQAAPRTPPTTTYYKPVPRRILEKALRDAGYRPERQSGHEIWKKPGGPTVALPNHKEISPPVAKKILDTLKSFRWQNAGAR